MTVGDGNLRQVPKFPSPEVKHHLEHKRQASGGTRHCRGLSAVRTVPDNDSQLCMLSDLIEDNTLDDQHRSEAYRIRGRLYRQLVRYNEALTDLNRAIDLDPQADRAIAHRGHTYRRMGRYEDALADFTRAIDLDPQSDWAIAGRDETYRLMGRYEDALADLTQAIDLDEDGWTYYQMALVRLSQGRAHDARERLQCALRVEREQIFASPEDRWRQLNVAVYLMALGIPDEAREQVHETLKLSVSIKDISDAIQDFEDLQMVTGSDISEMLRLLRASLR